MPKINQEEYGVLKKLKDEVGSMIIPIKYDTNGYDNSDDIHDYNEALVDVIRKIDETKELPVIPKFVADWIEEVKPDNSLRVAFEYIAQQKRDNYDDELAFWVEEGNSETFARAWLDGYEVAEEQKYYVLDKEGHLLIRGFSDGTVGRVGDRMKPDLYPDWNKKNLPLTEQEIKDYDPRYMTFAKPVEELEVLKEEK